MGDFPGGVGASLLPAKVDIDTVVWRIMISLIVLQRFIVVQIAPDDF